MLNWIFLGTALGASLPAYRPTTVEIAAAYQRADTIGAQWQAMATNLRLDINWIDGGKALWFRNDLGDRRHEFVRVDARTGRSTPLFDAKRLATALAKETQRDIEPQRLPFRDLEFRGDSIRFTVDRQGWEATLDTYALRKFEREAPRPNRQSPWRQNTWPPSRQPLSSPDRTWTARISGYNLMLRQGNGEEKPFTTDGTSEDYFARIWWSADSSRLLAVRVKPGDRKKVYLIQNAPPIWGPVKLSERIYDRPGDVVDTFKIVAFDPRDPASSRVVGSVDYGDMPSLRPTQDGAFTYERMDRGYGRWRIFRIDPGTGTSKAIVDDDPETFVDSTALIARYLNSTSEIVYSSERDGWHHLYLADGKGGSTQITRGTWVVRELVSLDEAKRELVFTAGGRNAGEDPYFLHYYRIGLDGKGLTELTPGVGTHTVSFAPDGQTLVDTYSTVVEPPVHVLRDARTGTEIATIAKADIRALNAAKWCAPQPFVAKGRDRKTDIYGLVFRPTNFDPRKRYPVVEDIYAGPQDSFVPKAFSPNFYLQRLAELGFIVVKIDGMGTRNRSKAFHDVCYRNLADAGFPDRILWMKALAQSDPSVDLTRVGIFGTSAGGQSAGGAVLFHPDFYKVAVASCGCHDNRLDKIWWNEQWMGLMGPHYAENSNIEHASKLRGNLMLIVGELDTNVPPESTYRFAAALQAAGKEYELVVIPNSDHTSGGTYGERKRRDFLVRHLHGVEPPNPNGG